MADQFADAFKRYWAVIVTVCSIMMALGAGIYKVSADRDARISVLASDISEIKANIRELKATTQGNYARIEEFRVRTENTRYTDNDAERDQRRIWDAIQHLEETVKAIPQN